MLPVFESCTEGAIDAFEMFDFNVNTLLKIVPETVRPVRVPTLVIFACALPVTADDNSVELPQKIFDPVPFAVITWPTVPDTPEIERFERFTKYVEFIYGAVIVFKLKFIFDDVVEKVEVFNIDALMVVANTFVVWMAFDA